MIGFTNYDKPTVEAVDTQAIIKALTSEQRTGILNGFATKKSVVELKHALGCSSFAIKHLYKKINEIEEYCRVLMRGEILEKEAVIDTEGKENTPAVYKEVPKTITGLKAEVEKKFEIDFTKGQAGAVVDKMIAFSKSDGKGDAAFYAAEVIK